MSFPYIQSNNSMEGGYDKTKHILQNVNSFDIWQPSRKDVSNVIQRCDSVKLSSISF